MKYIAYYRVSTDKQGESGLGLEAQKSSVINFISEDDILINEYREVESGKNNERIQLLEALSECKRVDATLLIAKLDRLSRNAAFIFTLKDSGVKFKCVDMPEANSVTIGIMAVLAQDERERISHRTKVALAALKAKGVKLGKPENLTDEARRRSVEARKKKANSNEHNTKATSLIKALRSNGASFRDIAQELNDSGFKTSRDSYFSAMTVKRLYDRI